MAQLGGRVAAGRTELPNPALIVVQTVDNDIRCDGSDARHVASFVSQLADALAIINDRAPDAPILVVSLFYRPAVTVVALCATAWAEAEAHRHRGSATC